MPVGLSFQWDMIKSVFYERILGNYYGTSLEQQRIILALFNVKSKGCFSVNYRKTNVMFAKAAF